MHEPDVLDPRTESRLLAIWRQLSGTIRVRPDFLIIGAQRCGTTSLHAWLERRSGVHAPGLKEVHFFDACYERGLRWYQAHFPTILRRSFERARGRTFAAFESTPYYLFEPRVPARVRAALPRARLIVLLRNPVDRALSHHDHEVRRGTETVHDFAEAIDLEEQRISGEEERLRADPGYKSPAHMRFSYLARGLYARQLRAWLEHFPPEQLLVLRSEDLFTRSGETLASVLRFLELPEEPLAELPRENTGARRTMDADLRARLVEYFRPHNHELEQLLGRELGWDR